MKQIPLSQGKFALVDDEDYNDLNKFRWCAINTGKCTYACRMVRLESGKQGAIRMHRSILKITQPDVLCDHRDGNGLNNQKSNLRICGRSENACNRGLDRNNTSGFKGVCWDKSTLKWLAYIKKNGRLKNLGRFKSRDAAAVAYDEAAKTLHGEFAKTNQEIKI